MMNEKVCALSLPRAALPRYDNTLISLSLQHGVVSHVSHGINVWLQMPQCVIIIHFDILWVVDGQELKGVNDNEDASDVSVDLFLEEARAQVVQQRALVELRQVTQVGAVALRVRLGKQPALHHAPALLCDLQPHLETAAVVDGAIQVLLPQEEAVILATGQWAVLKCHAGPQHHPLHGTVGRVQDPFLATKLLHLSQDVTLGAVQLQAIDDTFDGLGSCGGLSSADWAVDGALGKGAWVDAHGELRVLIALPPAQGAKATNAITSTHGGAGVPMSSSLALARPLVGCSRP